MGRVDHTIPDSENLRAFFERRGIDINYILVQAKKRIKGFLSTTSIRPGSDNYDEVLTNALVEVVRRTYMIDQHTIANLSRESVTSMVLAGNNIRQCVQDSLSKATRARVSVGKRGRLGKQSLALFSELEREKSGTDRGMIQDKGLFGNNSPSAMDVAIQNEEMQLIQKRILGLNSVERTVWDLRVNHELTMQEIGEHMGFTESRAAQIFRDLRKKVFPTASIIRVKPGKNRPRVPARTRRKTA